jgi:hypothetical protein
LHAAILHPPPLVALVDAMAQRGRTLTWTVTHFNSDREGVDVFAAQSDIALRVGDALNASVTLEEQARVGKRPTSSVAAYELYIRALDARGKTSEEHRALQIELLRKAVALDPGSRWPMRNSATRTTSRAPTGICPRSPEVSMRRARRLRSTRSSPRATACWD